MSGPYVQHEARDKSKSKMHHQRADHIHEINLDDNVVPQEKTLHGRGDHILKPLIIHRHSKDGEGRVKSTRTASLTIFGDNDKQKNDHQHDYIKQTGTRKQTRSRSAWRMTRFSKGLLEKEKIQEQLLEKKQEVNQLANERKMLRTQIQRATQSNQRLETILQELKGDPHEETQKNPLGWSYKSQYINMLKQQVSYYKSKYEIQVSELNTLRKSKGVTQENEFQVLDFLFQMEILELQTSNKELIQKLASSFKSIEELTEKAKQLQQVRRQAQILHADLQESQFQRRNLVQKLNDRSKGSDNRNDAQHPEKPSGHKTHTDLSKVPLNEQDQQKTSDLKAKPQRKKISKNHNDANINEQNGLQAQSCVSQQPLDARPIEEDIPEQIDEGIGRQDQAIRNNTRKQSMVPLSNHKHEPKNTRDMAKSATFGGGIKQDSQTFSKSIRSLQNTPLEEDISDETSLTLQLQTWQQNIVRIIGIRISVNIAQCNIEMSTVKELLQKSTEDEKMLVKCLATILSMQYITYYRPPFALWDETEILLFESFLLNGITKIDGKGFDKVWQRFLSVVKCYDPQDHKEILRDELLKVRSSDLILQPVNSRIIASIAANPQKWNIISLFDTFQLTENVEYQLAEIIIKNHGNLYNIPSLVIIQTINKIIVSTQPNVILNNEEQIDQNHAVKTSSEGQTESSQQERDVSSVSMTQFLKNSEPSSSPTQSDVDQRQSTEQVQNRENDTSSQTNTYTLNSIPSAILLRPNEVQSETLNSTPQQSYIVSSPSLEATTYNKQENLRVSKTDPLLDLRSSTQNSIVALLVEQARNEVIEQSAALFLKQLYRRHLINNNETNEQNPAPNLDHSNSPNKEISTNLIGLLQTGNAQPTQIDPEKLESPGSLTQSVQRHAKTEPQMSQQEDMNQSSCGPPSPQSLETPILKQMIRSSPPDNEIKQNPVNEQFDDPKIKEAIESPQAQSTTNKPQQLSTSPLVHPIAHSLEEIASDKNSRNQSLDESQMKNQRQTASCRDPDLFEKVKIQILPQKSVSAEQKDEQEDRSEGQDYENLANNRMACTEVSYQLYAQAGIGNIRRSRSCGDWHEEIYSEANHNQPEDEVTQEDDITSATLQFQNDTIDEGTRDTIPQAMYIDTDGEDQQMPQNHLDMVNDIPNAVIPPQNQQGITTLSDSSRGESQSYQEMQKIKLSPNQPIETINAAQQYETEQASPNQIHPLAQSDRESYRGRFSSPSFAKNYSNIQQSMHSNDEQDIDAFKSLHDLGFPY